MVDEQAVVFVDAIALPRSAVCLLPGYGMENLSRLVLAALFPFELHSLGIE